MPTFAYKVKVELDRVNPELRAVLGPNLVEGKEFKVPGTTTVIGRFKESGGLIHWAWNEGKEGRDYRATRDAAGDAGTLAHAMVEADIRGTKPPNLDIYNEEMVNKAKSSFAAYLEWKEQTKVKVVKTEVPLTSKVWLFGGCLDAVEIDSRTFLLDWKTSNGIYQDHIIQVGGGYSLLWEENFPEIPITGGFKILRFSKQDGDFTHHNWSNLDQAKAQFKHFRVAFELDKALKARL